MSNLDMELDEISVRTWTRLLPPVQQFQISLITYEEGNVYMVEASLDDDILVGSFRWYVQGPSIGEYTVKEPANHQIINSPENKTLSTILE